MASHPRCAGGGRSFSGSSPSAGAHTPRRALTRAGRAESRERSTGFGASPACRSRPRRNPETRGRGVAAHRRRKWVLTRRLRCPAQQARDLLTPRLPSAVGSHRGGCGRSPSANGPWRRAWTPCSAGRRRVSPPARPALSPTYPRSQDEQECPCFPLPASPLPRAAEAILNPRPAPAVHRSRGTHCTREKRTCAAERGSRQSSLLGVRPPARPRRPLRILRRCSSPVNAWRRAATLGTEPR